jgi:DNA (cytosine-5)-methyltransferase 1
MVAQPTEVSGTIAARFGQSRNNHEECVVQPTAGTLGNRGLRSHTELDGHGAYIPVAQPVPYDLFQITAPVNRQNRKPGDPCHTLAKDNAAHAAIAIQGNLVGRETGGPQGVGASTDGAMYTLTKADTHAVAFGLTTYETPKFAHEVQPTLTVPSPSGGGQPPAVAHAMTVRRLSCREAERLQGFPDDWTLIPWRKKPAEECPDGPRYKALGNSMACNCMAWIGERIAAYEQRGRVDPTPAGTAGIAPAGDLDHEGDRHG